MIDRFGNRIHVGWADHEIIWLKAALILTRAERQAAYRDIASLTGRSLESIRAQASKVWAQQQAMSAPRHVLVPARSHIRSPKLLPSLLKQPTLARLMGCR